jgi:uncharacterized integral membrane protein
MPEPHLRAADVDRTAVADVLGTHMSAGRLTVAEYDERLTRAYAAKTYGELDELTADLPLLQEERTTPAVRERGAPDHPLVAHAGAHPWAGGRHHGRPELWTHGWHSDHSWRAWLSTGLIVLAIWAVTSLASWELQYFWPMWVIGPWGALLLAQAVTGTGEDDDRGRRHLPG